MTWLGELKNQVIEIEELISVNGENYDRHLTTRSNISMILKNFGVRFSGGIAMLQSDCQDYEFRIGATTAILRTDYEITVTEKLSESVFRRTRIKNKI